MRTRLLSWIVCLPMLLSAQTKEWAPIGAKWYYNQIEWSEDGNRFIKNAKLVIFHCTKDSTIGNYPVKIIEVFERTIGNNLPILISRDFIYQHDDTIFYYNPYHDKFFVLYNFAAKPGDTIHVHNQPFTPIPSFNAWTAPIPSFSYVVEGYDSIEIDGIYYRKQVVTNDFDNSSWAVTYTGSVNIIEKIGNLQYFYGPPFVSPLLPVETLPILRCYDDSMLHYKNSLWEYTCDMLKINFITKDKIKIFPNPFVNYVSIKSIQPIAWVELYSISGQRVLHTKGNDMYSIQLNTTNLLKGFYLLKMKTSEKLYYQKLLKP